MDPIERAAWASERTANASRVKDAAARASDQAVRASVEIIQRNAETVQHTLQHTLQCGAKLAAQMTQRSADQFGRAIGFSGEGAQKAAQKSSHNIEAIVQSGMILSEITQRLSEEWADIARARMDRGFDRIDALCSAARRRISPHCRASCCATTWKLFWVTRIRRENIRRAWSTRLNSGSEAWPRSWHLDSTRYADMVRRRKGSQLIRWHVGNQHISDRLAWVRLPPGVAGQAARRLEDRAKCGPQPQASRERGVARQ